MKHKITGYPKWLTISEDRTSFTLEPEKAAIVRRIFEMSCDGLGCYTIAKQLNDQKVPAFGSSGRWDQSTIDKMLRNRAAIGELQPYVSKNDRATYQQPPLPGYYPAAIDQALFDATQTARARNGRAGRGRKGEFVTNLFGKLVTCLHCGSPVAFKSRVDRKSMVCSGVFNGSCYRYGWAYPNFEAAVFETILMLDGDHPTIDEAIRLIQSLPTADKYYTRMEISKTLRNSVQFLGMAAAGENAERPPPNARIRRNKSGRYLEIQFAGGQRHRSKVFQ